MATIHTASRAKLDNTLVRQLPGVPNKPMDHAQQLEALKRAQAQAEQRVKLGLQLFKAAEAHTSQHRAMLDQLKTEQTQFQNQLHEDVARSLQTYDQWVGHLDDTLTKSLHTIEDRISQLQAKWVGTEERIDAMLRRSEALLDQSRQLLSDASNLYAAPPPVTPPAPAPAPPVESAQPSESAQPVEPIAPPPPDPTSMEVLPMPVPETISQAPADDEESGATAIIRGGDVESGKDPTQTQLYSQLVERLRDRRGSNDAADGDSMYDE